MTAVFEIQAAREAGLPVGVQIECGPEGHDFLSCPRCGFCVGDLTHEFAGKIREAHEDICSGVPVTDASRAEATRLATNILGVGLVRILAMARA